MNILVLNCGSSSLKYRLIAMPGEVELAGGEAQRVGPPTAEPSRIVHRVRGQASQTHFVRMADHAAAFSGIMNLLSEEAAFKPEAIGHRVVHGGDRFRRHTIVDASMIGDLETLGDLAPLHNPPAIQLIKTCHSHYPDLPQVAVFDTVFHSTIPEKAYTYALPRQLRTDFALRKYGFHGISHQYVATEAARMLSIPVDRLNAVSCHLGSGGASLCAIQKGRSIDNTMGYSPLQGLIMSTRCGNLDPAIALQLLAINIGDTTAVEKALNEQSGVLGLSGKSADIRDALNEQAGLEQGCTHIGLTAQVYLWRLRKYLGAYLATTGRANAVIFTDTIGETVPLVRGAMCANMEFFGLRLDAKKNEQPGTLPADIAQSASPVRILVIPTNEELSIARTTHQLLHALQPVEGAV